MTTSYRKILTIRSHSGLCRYLANVDDLPIYEIPRLPEIRSPYAYSLVHSVWRHSSGIHVFIVETRHRHYEVFEVLAGPVEARP